MAVQQQIIAVALVLVVITSLILGAQVPARDGPILPVLLDNIIQPALLQPIALALPVVLMNIPAVALLRNVRPRLYFLAPLEKDLRTEG